MWGGRRGRWGGCSGRRMVSVPPSSIRILRLPFLLSFFIGLPVSLRAIRFCSALRFYPFVPRPVDPCALSPTALALPSMHDCSSCRLRPLQSDSACAATTFLRAYNFVPRCSRSISCARLHGPFALCSLASARPCTAQVVRPCVDGRAVILPRPYAHVSSTCFPELVRHARTGTVWRRSGEVWRVFQQTYSDTTQTIRPFLRQFEAKTSLRACKTFKKTRVGC